MKNIYLLAFTLFVACVNSSNNAPKEYESTVIKLQSTKAGFVKVPYGSVYAIAYNSKGEITNESESIFASPVLEMEIELHLKNGNIINNAQIDPAPYPIPSYRKLLKGQFLPGDNKLFELSSPRLKKEYTKYPIDKVYIAYYLTGQDPLNNQKEIGSMIRKLDVTEEWNLFTNDFDEKNLSPRDSKGKKTSALNAVLQKDVTQTSNKPAGICSGVKKGGILMPHQVLNLTYKQLLDSLHQHNITYNKEKELAEDEFIGYKLITGNGEYFLTKSNIIAAYSFKSGEKIANLLSYLLNENASIETQEQGYYLIKYQRYHIQLSDLGDSVLVSLNKD